MKNHFVVALALASAAVLAVVAGSAGAKATDDIFSVHALVSDGAATPAPGDRRIARQRLGPERRPDDAVVGGEQRHATPRRSTAASARRRALTVTVAGGPTGTVFNGNAHRLRRQPERQERRRALPVRDRGRHDPRLDADGERHDRGRRRRPLGGSVRSTRASPSRATGCTRPTSTTAASTSSTRRSS